MTPQIVLLILCCLFFLLIGGICTRDQMQSMRRELRDIRVKLGMEEPPEGPLP